MSRSLSDFVRLMHLPLPLCVIAFATIGASLADKLTLKSLALTYVGILLALCLGAYSLDELHGRPYRTRFEDRTLRSMAAIGMVGGSAVAAYLMLTVSVLICIPAALAGFFILAYNLELFKGRFHNAGWFGASWGGLSTLGGYLVQTQNITIVPFIASVMATLVGVSIVYLTHKFRPQELTRKLEIARSPILDSFSRYARKAAWEVVKIECYAMITPAIAMILPRLI